MLTAKHSPQPPIKTLQLPGRLASAVSNQLVPASMKATWPPVSICG